MLFSLDCVRECASNTAIASVFSLWIISHCHSIYYLKVIVDTANAQETPISNLYEYSIINDN